MHNLDLNKLSAWKNPVHAIKDPLKQRWAEIRQSMQTHIDGVCPLHIYINRRPLESQNAYAIEYRVNNFQPLTKDAFDRSINGIVEHCASANLQAAIPESITDYELYGKPIIDFCNSDLVRIREKDPNAVIVALPLINEVELGTVSINDVEVLLVGSDKIEHISNDDIEFVYGIDKNKNKILVNIDDGQYTLRVPDEKGKYTDIPIVKLKERKPFVNISDNVVQEGEYKLRLPYLFGACAWGDKFYGQESDFSVQATRYTYLKEIRAKEKCDELGMIFVNGKHCSVDNQAVCGKCGGSGYVKDDSPLGTIYVDYSKLNSEERAFPQVVQWAEPPQSALTSSKEITDTYFERMCEALGLVKQNYTNQSGVSKAFDYKEKISTITKVFNDNIRTATETYRLIEYLLLDENIQTTQISVIGELGQMTVNDLMEKLTESKTNQSPPYIISSLVDQIYQKTLPTAYAPLIIKTAKFYDKLYMYGTDEITKARAQFGNALTQKDVVVHNTIVDVIMDYLTENGVKEMNDIVAYLDSYYERYAPAPLTGIL